MFSRIDIDTILLMLIQDVYINTPLKFPYSFYRKERDSETGFSYFGARYYDSDLMTGWLSVDPMADKYPNISPYAYCAWNPILFKDPDGKEKIISFKINATDLLKRKDERFLDDAARHYTRNIGVIHIFAHGAIDKEKQKCVGFWTYQDGDISNAILDPQALDGYLRDNSAIYRRNNKEREVSKTSILVLHSCRTGEQGSIAQQASADLNLLIIAPSENVGVSKASPDGYKEKVSDDGVWNVYYKGELMECFDGKTKPLFNNVEKTIEKYETMYQERHRQSFD